MKIAAVLLIILMLFAFGLEGKTMADFQIEPGPDFALTKVPLFVFDGGAIQAAQARVDAHLP